MTPNSWGCFPKHDIEVLTIDDAGDYQAALCEQQSLIHFGNGRSYGDSALNDRVLVRKSNNLMLSFDQEQGILCCQAGMLLSNILDTFVNRGWFLAVTPGTKYVTVAGAISSDVHGKNQHKVGSFSDFVISFRLLLADSKIVNCSKDENSDLFKAACGGMGLIGIILDACIQLKKIESSFMSQSTVVTHDLKETLLSFEKNNTSSYSVAWIDCFAKGKSSGRAIINYAEHARGKPLRWQSKKPHRISVLLCNLTSSLLLNRLTGKIFNILYYNLNKSKTSDQIVDLNSYFYPLDSIDNWNRLYGKSGFLQYQFVIPKENAKQGLEEILSAISNYRQGAYLAVLKLFGRGNDNYLSFPMEGYTLAVDFKMMPGLQEFLKQLDKIVVHYNGRFYLAKDSRLDADTFQIGYPQIDKFKAIRKQYNLLTKFQSYQSKRLNL